MDTLQSPNFRPSPVLRHRTGDVPDPVDVEARITGAAIEADARSGVWRQVNAAGAPIRVSPSRFLTPASLWALGTFVLCYVTIPFGYSLTGLRPMQLAWTLPGAALAFLLTWGCTAAWLMIRSRQSAGLELDTHKLATRDRIPAAMAGGLMVWLLMHNTLPGLIHFGTMSHAFLAAFLAANLVETALFGTILATVTRTRGAAFAAGALFHGALALGCWFF